MSRRCPALVLVICLLASACHDDGGVRVAKLDITGAEAFSEDTLKATMQTRQGGRWPWSRWRPFDKDVFARDLERLREFYRDRGYERAVVRATEVQLAEDGHTIRLAVAVEEGEPTRITDVTFEGLDGLPDELVTRIRRLAPEDNAPRTVAALNRLREGALSEFRERGYPHATVELQETPDDTARTVAVTVRAVPGPETHFGDLQMNGLERTKHVVVRRAVTFKPGDLYRESDVLASQRRLRQIAAFEFAHLAPTEEATANDAPVLPMVATIAEAKPHRFEIGVGYGTEDRFRGSFEWRNVNFFGNGSQWVGNARYSTVTRGAGFGYDHPYLLNSGGILDARAGAWWTNERSFTSRSAGGTIGFVHEFGREGNTTVRGQYRYERLKYRVTDETLRFDERTALGLDPNTGQGDGAVAGLEVTVRETRVDNPSNPRRGVTMALTAEHVAPWVGSTFRYDELSGELRGYLAMGSRVTFAARARYGTLSSTDSTQVPFAERFFLGGSTTMRGWGRYEVGPTSVSGLPIGGRSVFDSSIELRTEVCCGFGVVAFTDIGNVWDEDWTFRSDALERAVGGGLRYQTIVGVVRADFGYQLTPIPGLRIDGKPQTRRWRLHLSIGHAF